MIVFVKRDIEASTKVRAGFARAREVLVRDPGTVVADNCSAKDRRDRRFRATLGVEVGAGGGGLHQEVIIEVGIGSSTDHAVVLPVSWLGVGHERLLPAFAGALELSEDEHGSQLALRGTYSVPLGLLGRFGDGVAGRRVVHRSLEAFVAQAARRLDTEVDRRHESVAWHPASYPVALRESGSETYIG